MDKPLANLLAVVQLLCLPITKLLHAVRFVLSPILRLVLFLLSPIAIVGGFVLLPFVHLAKGLFHVVTLPLQVEWLERIETLYIYLGTAGLIGCMTGAVLYFIFKFLSSTLSIDAASKPPARRARTTAEFRTAQREKREKLSPVLQSPNRVAVDRTPSSRRRGLLSQTIVEEEDSDL
ncbi:hypothetical protein C7974DRAFT_414869 [Boeremia exigua]|uniref:uncharacterized protein n=1 Tax=Boeremia exigua TaxID=749465 RepID=UPI001E8D263C|nr:uncharacterized protein C7974DRAFT_414869 [Boeremia exigua]KAH6622211.1 hypothetical protein C7974DRAFT_414869 [Boeremia exigua]